MYYKITKINQLIQAIYLNSGQIYTANARLIFESQQYGRVREIILLI